jgi:hypothetical protein
MHVSGNWTRGDLWIAGVGFELQSDKAAVDASGYAGVSFYARTDEEDTQVRLQVMIEEVEDDGHFAIELALTDSWQLFEVKWDSALLIQPTWAAQVTFDPATLWKFQFQFDSEKFDLWVDDIHFIEP